MHPDALTLRGHWRDRMCRFISCPPCCSQASTAATVSLPRNRRWERPSGSLTATSSTPSVLAGGSAGTAVLHSVADAVLSLVVMLCGAPAAGDWGPLLGPASSSTPDFRFVVPAVPSGGSASRKRTGYVPASQLVNACSTSPLSAKDVNTTVKMLMCNCVLTDTAAGLGHYAAWQGRCCSDGTASECCAVGIALTVAIGLWRGGFIPARQACCDGSRQVRVLVVLQLRG